MAVQSVTAVGILAVITNLLLAPLTMHIDLRTFLFVFSVLLVLSDIMVGLAPDYPVLLAGRCILGMCVGGFWSMASAVVLRLVPSRDVTRALSIIYAGVSVGITISIPLASYIG